MLVAAILYMVAKLTDTFFNIGVTYSAAIIKAYIAANKINLYIMHPLLLKVFMYSKGTVCTTHTLHFPVYCFHNFNLVTGYQLLVAGS